MTSGPAPRVSVVVPVFDPGPYIEPAIASILGQTLPPGAVEAIFVDDGSTDGTAERLDRLAADRPDIVRVVHIPPSGSPGRPRNVGIAAARGDYIQFLDADDELALDALERLLALADRNGSDIVVGKFASATETRSQTLFARGIDLCTIHDTPRLADSSLGPTKLYRRAFLEAHGITFPEGWRLIEDQAFTLLAYLRAHAVTIAADRPYYFFNRRADGANLTSQPIDPPAHFANLRTLFDLVERETPPGPLRDHILRRLIRVEVLRRVGERVYPDLAEAARAGLMTEARDFVRDRVTADVATGLRPADRVRLGLLRDDRPAELLAMAERMRDLAVKGAVREIGWRAGILEVLADAAMVVSSTDRPFTLVGRDGGWFLDPSLAEDLIGQPVEVTDDLGGPNMRYVLRSTETALEWPGRGNPLPLPDLAGTDSPRASLAAHERPLPIAGTVRFAVDPSRVGAGRLPLDRGSWEVRVLVAVVGISRHAGLATASETGVEAACRPALLGTPARIVLPRFAADGLRLEVDPPAVLVAAALAGRPVRVVSDGARLVLELAIAAGPAAGPLPVRLVVADPAGERSVAAVLRARHATAVIDAPTVGLTAPTPGPHPLLLRLDGPDGPADVALGMVRANQADGLRVVDLERVGPAERFAAAVRWRVVQLRRLTRGALRRARRASGR